MDLNNISLELIALTTGVIGSITGVISFIWHILNSRPKIIMESTYFTKEEIVIDPKEGDIQHVGVKITLRNLGNRSSTIEDIYIMLGNRVEFQKMNLPTSIKGNSSKILSYYLRFKKKDFEELYEKRQLHFEVLVIHTFGTIKKRGKSDFLTGHFTIK